MGGNHRFRLSDMIPNAWFYKLREIGRAKNQTSKKKKQHPSSSNQQLQQQCNPRKSYYFTRELHPPNNNNLNSLEIEVQPSKPSSKHKTTTRRVSAQPARNRGGVEKEKTPSSSVSAAGCSCGTTLDSVWTKEENFSTESESSPDPEFRTDRVLIPSELSSFDEMLFSSTTTTTTTDVIVIDIIDKNSLPRKDDKLQNYKCGESREQHEVSKFSRDFTELQLRPIITKPSNKIKFLKEQKRSGINSPGGVKLRVNSPKIANRRVQSRGQSHSRKSLSSSKMTSSDKPPKSISGSFAIAKSSFNPQKDFRESMVEMIVENNIRESKDLEELLACYLSLNSDQYHEIIIKVFKQIWFDLTQRS